MAIHTPRRPRCGASRADAVMRTPHMLARFMMLGTSVSPAPAQGTGDHDRCGEQGLGKRLDAQDRGTELPNRNVGREQGHGRGRKDEQQHTP